MDRQQLRQKIDLAAQVERDTTLTRVASTKGGEWSGPCPLPGCSADDDGFNLWPNHDSGWPQFWCRRCNRGGDAITYVMERDGLTFSQVKRAYGDGADGGRRDDNGRKWSKPGTKPMEPPGADWQTAAKLLVADSETVLWSPEGEAARRFLRDERGLSDETMVTWRLGLCRTSGRQRGLWCERGITIPWFDASGRLWSVKVKTGKTKKGERYKAVGGSRGGGLFGVDRLSGRPDCFVVEGELDALLLWQEIGGAANVLTLGAAGSKLAERWIPALLPTRRFWIVTDNDAEGEQAAEYWLGLVGERGRRIYPPGGEKDVTEAHQAGADLRTWALGYMGGGALLDIQRQLERLLDELRQCDDDVKGDRLLAEYKAWDSAYTRASDDIQPQAKDGSLLPS